MIGTDEGRSSTTKLKLGFFVDTHVPMRIHVLVDIGAILGNKIEIYLYICKTWNNIIVRSFSLENSNIIFVQNFGYSAA